MALIRALLKVDENGQITIPKNIVKALKIRPSQFAELRLLPRNKIQLTPQEKLSPKKQ